MISPRNGSTAISRNTAVTLCASLTGSFRRCFCAAFATTMVQVMEKIVQSNKLATRYLGFSFTDGSGFGFGGPVGRLLRRYGDPSGRRREFQLISNLDSGLPPDAPRHNDFGPIFDDRRHTSRVAEPGRLSTPAGSVLPSSVSGRESGASFCRGTPRRSYRPARTSFSRCGCRSSTMRSFTSASGGLVLPFS